MVKLGEQQGPVERDQLRFQYAATASGGPRAPPEAGVQVSALQPNCVTRAVSFTSAPGLLDVDGTHLHSRLTDDVGIQQKDARASAG